GPLRGVIVYFTLHHDPDELIEAFVQRLGPDVPLVGASVQGVASHGFIGEQQFLCGVIGWFGDLTFATHCEEEVSRDTEAKGRRLGAFANDLPGGPGALGVLLYDPLMDTNVRSLLQAMDAACPGLTVMGAGAGGPWGPMVETFQIHEGRVLRDAAVMAVIKGDFELFTGVSSGTHATGLAMRVTRAEGNTIQQLDDLPALDLWREATGLPDTATHDDMSSWGLGVERGGEGSDEWAVLAPFNYDREARSITLQVDVPVGTRVMLHQRNPDEIVDRARGMAEELASRIGSRRVGAVLSFECGARTTPYLGLTGAQREHAMVEGAVAPNGAAWLGLLAWGEIAPVGSRTECHNFTYPIAVLCHR
ncbi:MAG: FIST C-terminal domain-containing protein, partial [Myxococcales bacterium]|nr:FIST C-terminal domain-containing protein [Myxococcales bacterium]